MKRFFLLIQLLFVATLMIHADGGLWTSADINAHLAAMKKAGLKLSAKDIYQINQACLKDNVVGLSTARDKFNFFASGTFVSPSGLILTSSSVKTKLKDLCALQLVEMVDVTKELLAGTDSMTAAQRTNVFNERGKGIVEKYAKGRPVDGLISAFMDKFILSLYNIYRDVRLTATPNSELALLQVYTSPDKKPARYNQANIPLSGNAYAKISKTAARVGDFALTMGYPGRTKWYIPSFSLRYMQQWELPNEIEILKSRTGFIQDAIKAQPSEQTKLEDVLATLSKYCNDNQGVLDALNTTSFLTDKEKEEQALTDWIKADSKRTARYGDLMAKQKAIYEAMIPYKKAELLFNYALRQGSDVVSFIGKFEKLVQMFNHRTPKAIAVKQEAKRVGTFVDAFYATYNKDVQSKMFSDIMLRFIAKAGKEFIPQSMVDAAKNSGGDINSYINKAFDNSIINSREKVEAFLANVDSASIKSFVADPLYNISISYFLVYATRIADHLQRLQIEQSKYYKLYLQALLEKNGSNDICVDGNKTQRFSFGKVNEVKGQTFITDCFTTDGNSGSPIYNAEGYLIGINSGRTAQSAIGDYDKDTNRMKSINLDIRNILPVIQKQSGK